MVRQYLSLTLPLTLNPPQSLTLPDPSSPLPIAAKLTADLVTRGAPGPDHLRRLPPPPSLPECGWEVPDHGNWLESGRESAYGPMVPPPPWIWSWPRQFLRHYLMACPWQSIHRQVHFGVRTAPNVHVIVPFRLNDVFQS